MPIYAYRCAACGHAKDLLMKVGAAGPTTCPACGAEAFAKQVTAAGFQLKGSGWYVTDFRGGNSAAGKNGGKDGAQDGSPADASASKSDDKSASATDAKTDTKSDAKPAGESKGKAAPAVAAKTVPSTDKA